MRVARMGFNRMVLMQHGGITKALLKDMLDLMPIDTGFVGCGASICGLVDYMYFTSDSFKDVPPASIVPDITPFFIKNLDGTVSVQKIDLSDALYPIPTGIYNSSLPTMSSGSPCAHVWRTHQSLFTVDEYCDLCNTKKV